MASGTFSRSLVAGLVAASAFSLAGPAFGQDAKPEPKPAARAVPRKAQEPKEATLKVGDKAPALTIATWVKGKEVKSFESGHPYVVEFWATWCGPCIASMPHLSGLQKEYGNKLTIIGVTSKDPNNTLDKVEAMVKTKGDTMGYTVAWDTDRTTNEAYMRAANQNGIPTAFVIDQKGNVAWIGHPMLLDIVLEPVVAGKWDYKTGPELVKKAQDAQRAVYEKAGQGDTKAALEALTKLEKEYPKLAEGMGDMRFNLLMQDGNYEEAYKAATGIVDQAIAKKDATRLNAIAWTIVDPEGKVEKKDLDLALKAALKADEFSNHKDAAILDTLARTYFCKGDFAKAVETETKAVELADGQMKEDLQKSLDEFKAKAGKHD